MPPRTKPSSAEWEHHKITIRNLYLGQDLKLKEVQAQLDDFGFVASKSQYEAKLKEWGFSKNIPVNTWKHVGHKIEKRKREGKDSVISINGVEISAKRVKKETSRHFYSVAQRLEIERNNAPSPPDLSVATPASTQEVFFMGGWPMSLPWFTFTRSLDAHLSRIHRNPQTFHSELSWMRKKTEQSHLLSESHLGAPNSDVWQIVVDNIKEYAHLSLTHTLLPLTSDIECPAEIQQDMFLQSTSTDHWGLKVLIYLTSNKLLKTSSVEQVWQMINETGIRELAKFSESLHLNDVSLAAALEHLFQVGMKAEHMDLVSWLLDTGMNPNRRIKAVIERAIDNMHLPLIAAMDSTWSPNVKMLRLLLENGASPTLSCCDQHRSPMQFALENHSHDEDSEVLDLFLEVAKALNNDPASPSTLHVHHGDETDVNASLSNPDRDNAFDKMEYLVQLIQHHAAKTPQTSTPLITPEGLIRAVESKNQRLIRIMHKHGLSMNCCDGNGRFPLQAAVEMSEFDDYNDEIDPSGVDLLLDLGASPNYDPKYHVNSHCSPALQAAVNDPYFQCGKIEAIEILCQRGALVKGRPTCGKYDHHTLMDCAFNQKNWDLWQRTEVMLVLHNAGLSLPGSFLLDALELAYVEREDDWQYVFKDMIKQLLGDSLDLSLRSERGWTALDYAVFMNYRLLREFLVEKSVQHTRKFAFKYCLSPKEFSMEELEKVLARVRASQNTKQSRAWLIHHLIGTLRATDCSDRGSERVFELLHDYSLIARIPDHDAYVLYNVCRTGDTKFIRRTLELLPNTHNSAALWFLISDSNLWESFSKRRQKTDRFADFLAGTWIFTWAVRRALDAEGDTKALEWFNQHDRKPVEHANLHASAFSIKVLRTNSRKNLCKDADVTQWFTRGLKASCYLGLLVIETGDVEKLSALLDQGFRPNRRIAWSLTALQFAVLRADRPMTLRLLQEGCDVNARSPWRDIPGNILRKIPYGVLSAFISQYTSTSRRNAIQLAVESGDISMIKLLLDFGADVNGPPSRVAGATALQIACIKGYIDIVRLLVSRGADINQSGAEYHGRTALEGAAEHGRLDIACLLLEHDCQVNGSFRRQYIRAVGFARAQGHYVLSKTLEDFGEWKTADEDVLKKTDLRDKEPNSRDLDEDLDEEISEVDPDEFKSDSDSAYPFGTDHESDSEDYESDSGEYDMTSGNEVVAQPLNYACQEVMGGPNRLEQPVEQTSPQPTNWEDLLDYYGDDEREVF
ncbi:hypothetical protein PFICI_14058 [Pestalotiopsis fici W106-1]|uniref:Clr5 domain-containing protein n=1 Tax=Pestalotiopsis fici (strain W106-1 / CGMCC3.15140) TaxID=1229662 RepID=W3WLZ5_PESFW|nr:uncharacterized protein PFICI_14058 [Pestalotiopsis fici W106-1]ETS74192.1 hypothetical protein PFICI_14058 [Pestalotiopsis fici W106-1]